MDANGRVASLSMEGGNQTIKKGKRERICRLTERNDMLDTTKEELENIVRRFHGESRTALESSSTFGPIDIDTSDSDSSYSRRVYFAGQ